MVRRFFNRTIFMVAFMCAIFTSSVHASGIDSDFVGDELQIEEGNDNGGEGGVDSDPEGNDITEDGSSGISEQIETEVVTKEQHVFSPLPIIETGEASLTDVYNVLASIHNFLFLGLILALIVWTYSMITSSFRRFIG